MEDNMLATLVGTKYDDLIYDVGMHKGEDTAYYLQKGFRVIAFEANPELVEYCRNRFAAEIGDHRLIIVEGAIVDPDAGPTEGTIKFFRNIELSVWGTVSSDWAQRNEGLGTHNEVIEVRVIDFIECLKRYGIPHYMKIDIEGVDAACLKALLQFDTKPNYVSIESEKVRFGGLRSEFDLLTKLGYTSFKLVQQVTVPSQHEPEASAEGRYVGYSFQEGASGLFGKDLPGPWIRKQTALMRYAAIFSMYKLFGDKGFVNRSAHGRKFHWALERKLGRQIPGWYDTHAKHVSADRA